MQCLHNDVKGVHTTSSTAVQPSFTCYTALTAKPFGQVWVCSTPRFTKNSVSPAFAADVVPTNLYIPYCHHEFAKCIRKMDQNGEWVDDLNQIRRKAKERNKQIVCLPSHWVAFMRCIIWDICANGIRILQCWDYGVIGFDRWIIPDLMTRWDRHSLLWHALTTCLWSTTTFNICNICTKKRDICEKEIEPRPRWKSSQIWGTKWAKDR